MRWARWTRQLDGPQLGAQSRPVDKTICSNRSVLGQLWPRASRRERNPLRPWAEFGPAVPSGRVAPTKPKTGGPIGCSSRRPDVYSIRCFFGCRRHVCAHRALGGRPRFMLPNLRIKRSRRRQDGSVSPSSGREQQPPASKWIRAFRPARMPRAGASLHPPRGSSGAAGRRLALGPQRRPGQIRSN